MFLLPSRRIISAHSARTWTASGRNSLEPELNMTSVGISAISPIGPFFIVIAFLSSDRAARLFFCRGVVATVAAFGAAALPVAGVEFACATCKGSAPGAVMDPAVARLLIPVLKTSNAMLSKLPILTVFMDHPLVQNL